MGSLDEFGFPTDVPNGGPEASDSFRHRGRPNSRQPLRNPLLMATFASAIATAHAGNSRCTVPNWHYLLAASWLSPFLDIHPEAWTLRRQQHNRIPPQVNLQEVTHTTVQPSETPCPALHRPRVVQRCPSSRVFYEASSRPCSCQAVSLTCAFIPDPSPSAIRVES